MDFCFDGPFSFGRCNFHIQEKLHAVCYDLLDSRAPEQLIKQMLTILTKSLPLVQPPYGMINDESRTTLIEAESEEILPILDQFQNLRVFDQFFTESDFFLRKYEKSREDKDENQKKEKLENDNDENTVDNEMKKIHFPKLSLGPKPSGGARRKKSNPNLKVELIESGSKNGIPHTLRIDFISKIQLHNYVIMT